MKFFLIGNGFISRKHKEAIKAIGGKIARSKKEADVVSVLTPNYLHFKQAKDAAENKKIVLVEKPLAISGEEVGKLAGIKNVFTCHQLRYLPFKFPKAALYKIKIDFKAKRDKEYFKSWKGDKKKSGGILFNLAVHYFDLLFWLFGNPKRYRCCKLTDKLAEGRFYGKKYIADWRFELGENLENKRAFRINNRNYNLSSQENLHTKVYADLVNGKGVKASDVLKLFQIIEKIELSDGIKSF